MFFLLLFVILFNGDFFSSASIDASSSLSYEMLCVLSADLSTTVLNDFLSVMFFLLSVITFFNCDSNSFFKLTSCSRFLFLSSWNPGLMTGFGLWPYPFSFSKALGARDFCEPISRLFSFFLTSTTEPYLFVRSPNMPFLPPEGLSTGFNVNL